MSDCEPDTYFGAIAFDWLHHSARGRYQTPDWLHFERILEAYFGEWRQKQVAEMTADSIEFWLNCIEERFTATIAAQCAFLMHAVLMYDQERKPGSPVWAPLNRLSRLLKERREESFEVVLNGQQIVKALSALQQIRYETTRDCIFVILLSGQRNR